MKKIMGLIILLGMSALHAMDKQKMLQEMRENAEKTAARIKDEAALLENFKGLAEDYYWEKNVDAISVIQGRVNRFTLNYGDAAIDTLREEVLNISTKLKNDLQSVKPLQKMNGIAFVGSTVFTCALLWLGFSRYSKGHSLLSAYVKKGLCAALGLGSTLLMYVSGDAYFNDVERAQKKVDRYAQYEGRVKELFKQG